MKNNNYHRTFTVNASAEETMKKVSMVNKWWAKKTTGKTENLNDEFTVDFGETFVDFKISQLVPNKKVVWRVTDCNLHWIKAKKEWNGTEVAFELSENNGKTQIDFTHIGLVPEVECYETCEKGWDGHATKDLVNFINEGKAI